MISLLMGVALQASVPSSVYKISELYWARSWNFDENAKAVILPNKDLEDLGIAAEEVQGKQNVSAGVMHTYGYCVSTLDTPYGKKSKRWFEDRMDETLGLEPKTFSPSPRDGEFLANVTYVLRYLTLGKKDKIPGVGSTVVSRIHQSTARVVGRRTETGGGFRFVTDLLSGAEGKLLLVYSVQGPKDREAKLVTVFPVEKSFADGIQTKRPAMTPQFNLALNGFTPPPVFEMKYQAF